MKLKGKNILITGGSLGIGKETAKSLVDKGANVLVTGRSKERLMTAFQHTESKMIEFWGLSNENDSSTGNAYELVKIGESNNIKKIMATLGIS